MKQLESDGTIRKTPDPRNRRRIFYSLPEKGCDLAPASLEVCRRSEKYDPNSSAKKKAADRIENNREGLIAGLRARRPLPVSDATHATEKAPRRPCRG